MKATVTRRFIGRVLPDGHLSLPDDAAQEIGKIFDVVLMPVEGADVYAYAGSLAKEKGFIDMTEEDIEKIIHESRGVR